MKTPPKKLLIDRTLFNKNPSAESASNSSNISTHVDNSSNQNLSNSFPFSKTSVNPAQSNQVQSEIPVLSDIETLSTLFNSFSYSREVVIEWVKYILPRPTPLTWIFSLTLYLAAICSTIQRQQGDRWLGVLLQAKMPGCTKVVQEFSWETFENITSQSTYPSTSLSRSGNASNYSNIHSNENLQMAGSITANSSYNNLLESESPFNNILITDIDGYKDQALIHLRSPWNKQLRKEFLGFFPEQIENESSLKPISLSKGKQIALKWYKIGACNGSTRIIFPTEESSKENSKTNTLSLESLQPSLGMVAANQLNSLEAVNPLFLSFNARYGNTRQVNIRSHDHTMPEKILGFQYILPFNKKSIYIESDSIPSKLDSPYLNSGGDSFISKSLTPSNLLNFLATPNNLVNDHVLRARFEKSIEKAYGTDFTFFQTILKQLFYSYGLNGPSFFDSVIDQNFSEFKQKKAEKNNFLNIGIDRDILTSNKNDQNIADFEENEENDFLSEEEESNETNQSQKKKKRKNHLLSNAKKTKKNGPKSLSKREFHESSSDITSLNQSTHVLNSSNLSTLPPWWLAELRSSHVDNSSNQWFTRLSPFHQIDQYDPLEFESLSNSLSLVSPLPVEERIESLQLQSKQLDSVPNFESEELTSKKALYSNQSILPVSNSSNKRIKNQIEFLGLKKPMDPEDQKDHENFVAMFESLTTDSRRALHSSPLVDKPFARDSNDVSPFSSENSYSSSGLSIPDQKKYNTNIQNIDNKKEEINVKNLFQNNEYIDNLIEELCENSQDCINFQKVFATYFAENRVLFPRLMSGYKFPELTREETSSLFKQWVIPHLLLCSSVSFTPGQLLNSILLSPLQIQLPPTLPLSLIKNFAFPFLQSTPGSVLEPVPGNKMSSGSQKNSVLSLSFRESALPLNTSLNSAAEIFNVDIQYRRIRLEELSKVKEVFAKFGRDYDDYLSRPTDSPPAIAISPSLEDDKLIEEEHNRIIKERELARLKRDEDESEEKFDPTRFEDLQEVREIEKNFEKSKDFQRLAYNNKLAYHAERVDNDFPIEKEINSWIFSRVGHKNMLSDRKYSFLGRMHFLSKKLVAQLQKDINENILHNGQSAPYTKSSKTIDRQKYSNTSLPLRALEARARKDLIDLLEAPDFEIHNYLGVNNRKYRPDVRLRLKRRNVPYSHLNWHKRKSRSTLLGLPTNRHVVMPEITVNQWKNIIESELKKYFLKEGNRLHSLVKRNPEKTYKIKKINVYLPWVTVRTPSDEPFEWPLTRLDYTESPIPTQLDQIRLINFGSSFTDGSEKLRLAKLIKNPSQMDFVDYHLPETKNRLTFRFPRYKPVDYWGYRSYNTLSSHNNGVISTAQTLGKSKKNLEAGTRKKILNKQIIFEPITNYSYLFIYRLFLALALKEVLKYIYRITLKRFFIGIANSELGLKLMSPEFRSGLHHAPPKSFYKSGKLLRDVAGAEDANTIPVLSDLIWSIRNRGRGCAAPRGVLVVGPSGTEKTSLIQAIAGEAEVPIIVQSMRALTLTFNKPYERLHKIFKLARKQAPCVLFLDELDAIGKSRFNVVNSDIGSNDSLLSLDPEMGSTKLRLSHLTAALQTDLLQKKSSRSALSAALSSIDPLFVDQNISDNASGKDQGAFEKKGFQGDTSGADSREDNLTLTTSLQDQTNQGIKTNLVLQLLTELDGIKPLNGVVIIATSEQPALLDPALLRPGRFEKRIYLQLPNHEKRIDLFKAETKKIGSANLMPWDYFGIRTANMSGIDILSAINHSAIRAILDDTVHTVETLEHGLNCVIGLPNKKIRSASLQQSDPFHTSRLAFYQAGRGVVQTLLVEHPTVGFLSLTEPVATSVQSVLMSDSYFSEYKSEKITDRSSQGTPILYLPPQPRSSPFKNNESLSNKEGAQQSRRESTYSLKTEKKYISSATRTRIDLETRLVGLYGGKAGELLHVSANDIFHANTSQSEAVLTDYSKHLYLTQRQRIGWLWQSNLGFSELLTASSLIHLMIDRWYLYSTKVFTFKTNKVRGSLNNEQIRNQNFLQSFQQISKQLNSEKPKSGFWGNTDHNNQYPNLGSGTGGKKFMPVLNSMQQDYKKAVWWQAKVCQQLQMSERSYGKWFRIYLPKLEQNTQNQEWLSSDTLFYQKLTVLNLSKKRSSTLPSIKSLNDLYQFERDLQYQNTVINCFYTAFNLLHENRELLDLLADHLIRYKILRSYEISKICSLYIKPPTFN